MATEDTENNNREARKVWITKWGSFALSLILAGLSVAVGMVVWPATGIATEWILRAQVIFPLLFLIPAGMFFFRDKSDALKVAAPITSFILTASAATMCFASKLPFSDLFAPTTALSFTSATFANVLMGVGLIGISVYGVYRLYSAWVPESENVRDHPGVLVMLGLVVGGLIYMFFLAPFIPEPPFTISMLTKLVMMAVGSGVFFFGSPLLIKENPVMEGADTNSLLAKHRENGGTEHIKQRLNRPKSPGKPLSSQELGLLANYLQNTAPAKIRDLLNSKGIKINDTRFDLMRTCMNSLTPNEQRSLLTHLDGELSTAFCAEMAAIMENCAVEGQYGGSKKGPNLTGWNYDLVTKENDRNPDMVKFSGDVVSKMAGLRKAAGHDDDYDFSAFESFIYESSFIKSSLRADPGQKARVVNLMAEMLWSRLSKDPLFFQKEGDAKREDERMLLGFYQIATLTVMEVKEEYKDKEIGKLVGEALPIREQVGKEKASGVATGLVTIFQRIVNGAINEMGFSSDYTGTLCDKVLNKLHQGLEPPGGPQVESKEPPPPYLPTTDPAAPLKAT